MSFLSLYAQTACLWEAIARKPGNVHRYRDLPDLHFTDFLLSAVAIGPVLGEASERPLGETILRAIQATRAVVRTNTNLGIVLLLAPLASVPPGKSLTAGLGDLLACTTVEDARLTFAAIRLAVPGGMGEVKEQDVFAEPTLPLREVMALACERDLIARQYANGFREVLREGVPFLQQGILKGLNLEEAIIETHLFFLAHHRDSLIVRKWGEAAGGEVSRRAEFLLGGQGAKRRVGAREFDGWLREKGYNPGTSADLVTACLFVALREGIIKLPLEIPWSSDGYHG